jgi:hypothetical protein
MVVDQAGGGSGSCPYGFLGGRRVGRARLTQFLEHGELNIEETFDGHTSAFMASKRWNMDCLE